MNFNNINAQGGNTVGQLADKYPNEPPRVGYGAEAEYAGANAAAPESELQYAARVASEALQRLNKTVEELSLRLQVVLTPDAPTPTNGEQKQRAVQSPIGNALIQHAAQTDSIAYTVRNLLNRLAL